MLGYASKLIQIVYIHDKSLTDARGSLIPERRLEHG